MIPAKYTHYVFSFFMALLMAYVLNFFITQKERSIFLMELPVYRMPQWKNIVFTMIQKARVFVFDAGKIIFIISITYFSCLRLGWLPIWLYRFPASTQS